MRIGRILRSYRNAPAPIKRILTRRPYITLVALLIIPQLAACTADRTPKPSARGLLREAIHILATQPIGRDRVDWSRLSTDLEITVASDAPPAAAHPLIRNAVSRLNDPHSRFIPPPVPTPPADPPAQSEPANSTTQATSAAPRGEIPYVPSARMLDGDIAYVVVPMCAAADSESLAQYATTLRRAILDAEAHNPRGWLIELRFNGGGNVWPMLLGMRPILGDGLQMTGIAPDGGKTRIGCGATTAWMQRGDDPVYEQLRIEPPDHDRLIRSAPVAVLIGSWTMSAGEMAAISLRGRPRTRLFGDPTAGLTTATNEFPLSDGSKLILSVEKMGDRGGEPVPHQIPPDVPVDSADWPGPDDEVARAAIHWLRAEATEHP